MKARRGQVGAPKPASVEVSTAGRADAGRVITRLSARHARPGRCRARDFRRTAHGLPTASERRIAGAEVTGSRKPWIGCWPAGWSRETDQSRSMPAVCCCRTTGCAGCTKNSHPSTAPSMQPDRTSWRRVEYRIDAVRGALPVLAGVAAGRVRRSGPTPTVPITAAAFLMPICWNLTLRCTGATDTFSDLPFPVSWQDTVTGVRPRRCPDRPEPRVCGKEHRPPRRTAGPVGGARRCPHRHLHLLT